MRYCGPTNASFAQPVPEDGAAFSADHLSPRSIQTTSLMGALLFQQHQQREAQKDAAENTTPPGRDKGVKRRRVVKRDPNKPSPKAWSAEEVQRFKDLIEKEGPGGWEKKSVKLGSGRSAKALHTRWLREQGRIVDRPRGLTTSTSAESSPVRLLHPNTPACPKPVPPSRPIVSALQPPIADKLMVVVARQGHDASSTKSKSAGSRPRPAKAGSAKASSAKAAQKKPASSSSDSDDGSAPKRRRRIGTRDPNKPSPKAWSEEEVERFKQLIDADGPGSW